MIDKCTNNITANGTYIHIYYIHTYVKGLEYIVVVVFQKINDCKSKTSPYIHILYIYTHTLYIHTCIHYTYIHTCLTP
jgi:hypothetical protein